ncbi:hypothetical protein Psta_1108 [Pirellula staleyi DSM 6068]|uniref:NACHT domain-containing protein n=1 Tax=Pirellula staleyi (strain ATCC 27377 / DSM 6068 / ICPB 4128) TaxID=530564 RepID=D2R8H4_PIRSD|nr:NACHT domain-containing protein [Pirellula staleyi]ADB15791.1 hypothetical protein Psta_1108 [Pirellula staleyi DSM 6068]
MSDPLILLCSNEWDTKWPTLIANHLLALGLGREHVRLATADEAGRLTAEGLRGVESARLAILLVSPDFLASRAMMKEALPRLVIRANVKVTRGQTGDTEFLPVILKDCPWGLLPETVTVQVSRELQQPLEKRDLREAYRAMAYIARRAVGHLVHIGAMPSELAWSALPESQLMLGNFRHALVAAESVEREILLHQLGVAWMEPGTRVVNLVGELGVGKSSLVAHFLALLSREAWRGAERLFCWSFDEQQRAGGHHSADEFCFALRQFLSDVEDAPEAWWETGARLARLLQEERTLLVIDGLDHLLRADEHGTARIADDALLMLLRKLLHAHNGLCIVISKQPLADLAPWEGEGLSTIQVDRVAKPDSRELLAKLRYPVTSSEIDDAAAAASGHFIAARLIAACRAARGSFPATLKRHAQRLTSIPLDQLIDGLLQELLEAWNQPAITELLSLLACADQPLEVTTIENLLGHLRRDFQANSDVSAEQQPWGATLVQLDGTKLRAILAQLRGAGIVAHPATQLVVLQRVAREAFLRRQAPLESSRGAQLHRWLAEELQLQKSDGPITPPRIATLLRAMQHRTEAGDYHSAWHESFLAALWQQEDVLKLETVRDFCYRAGALELLIDPTTQLPRAGLSASDQWRVAQLHRHALRSAGRFSEAIATTTRHLERAKLPSDEQGGNLELVPHLLIELAQQLLLAGRVKDATCRVNELVALPDLAKQKQLFRDAVMLTARVLHLKGKFAEAIERYKLAMSIPRESSHLLGAEHWHVEAVFDSGNFPLAEKTAWREIDDVAPHDFAIAAGYRFVLGRLYLALRAHSGDWRYREEARKHVQQAGTLARKTGLLEMILPAQLAQAAVYRSEDHHPQAAQLLADVTMLSERFGLKHLSLDCSLEKLLLLLASGATVEVYEQLTPLKQKMTELLYGRPVRELRLIEGKFVVGKVAGSSAAAATPPSSSTSSPSTS